MKNIELNKKQGLRLKECRKEQNLDTRISCRSIILLPSNCF